MYTIFSKFSFNLIADFSISKYNKYVLSYYIHIYFIIYFQEEIL